MRNRKADSPLMMIIWSMIVFAVIMALFFIIYLEVSKGVKGSTLANDGNVDWEAGWIALSVANAPVDDTTFGAWAQEQDHSDAAVQQRTLATLLTAAKRTSIPGADSIGVFYVLDDDVACVVAVKGREIAECEYGTVSTAAKSWFDSDAFERFRQDSTSGVLSRIESQYIGQGNVGYAALPGDGAVIVMIGRTS